MNNEIKELIEDMQRFDNKWRNVDTKLAVATYPINQEQMPILLDYITNLQEKVNQYENPDDMTLFYMWLDTKAKDKIRKLEIEAIMLKQHNTMIAKLGDEYKSRNEKAIEYVNTHKPSDTISFPLMKKDEENQVKSCFDYEFREIYQKELLNILKGENNE